MLRSRRGFLLWAGSALAAGTALAACQSATPPASTTAPTAAPVVSTAPPASATAPAASSASAVPASSASTAVPASAATAAGATKSSYKLDLGGYNGPPLTDQPVKLRFMRQVYNPAVEGWWKARYAEWAKAYPNITFQEEKVPYGDLNTKMQTYVSAGDAPDIMMGKGDFVLAYAFNKIALNLSQFTAQSFINDLTPSAKTQLVVNGKLYASAWEQNQALLAFNKDMFAKAGVATPPETPDISGAWTWDQFGAACKKLTAGLNPGGQISTWALASSGYGNGGPGSSYWYEGIYIRSMGDPSAPKDSTLYKTFAGVSEDGLTASGYVDTPEAIAGMTFYQSEFKQKFTPTTAVANQYETGLAASRFGGTSTAILFKHSPPSFKYGFAPPPKGKIDFTHTTGDTPFVWAKSKHPAEAAGFLAFLTNDPNRITWHQTWGMTPARLSLFDKIGYNDQVGKLALDLTKHGYDTPRTPGYLEYFNAINAAVKDIALGANVADRLHKVAKEIDGLLSNYKG